MFFSSGLASWLLFIDLSMLLSHTDIPGWSLRCVCVYIKRSSGAERNGWMLCECIFTFPEEHPLFLMWCFRKVWLCIKDAHTCARTVCHQQIKSRSVETLTCGIWIKSLKFSGLVCTFVLWKCFIMGLRVKWWEVFASLDWLSFTH